MLRNHAFLLFTVFSVVGMVTGGCGGSQEPPSSGSVRRHPTTPPQPTRPATGAWGRGFDADTNFPEYKLTLVGSSWVQLDHLQDESTSMVVGVEPGLYVESLQQVLGDHRMEFDSPPLSRHREAGTVESEVLGDVNWSWANFDADGVTMTQLAVFAAHPNDNLLLLARSEFPSDSDDIQTELQQLVRATELIGPGL